MTLLAERNAAWIRHFFPEGDPLLNQLMQSLSKEVIQIQVGRCLRILNPVGGLGMQYMIQVC